MSTIGMIILYNFSLCWLCNVQNVFRCRGLVYRPIRSVSDARDGDGEHTQSGLHGMAQDQDIYIEADIETRNMEWEAAENEELFPTGSAASHTETGRQLRDIVRDSAEQWQLPTAEADREYTEELRAMGFSPQEIKERMNARISEYKVMLSRGCTRSRLPSPQRIPHLEHVRVKAVSAGYAHVMLLSDEGFLFGAGYNDRGQLGLGYGNLVHHVWKCFVTLWWQTCG